MSAPSYPFHSLLLKLSNNGMDFPFPSLKLPNEGSEEYSKIILNGGLLLCVKSEQKNNLSCAFKLEVITYHLYLMCKCCGYIISYCGCVCELVDVNRCKRIYSFGLSGLRLRLGVHKEIEWNGIIL